MRNAIKLETSSIELLDEKGVMQDVELQHQKYLIRLFITKQSAVKRRRSALKNIKFRF